MLMVSLLRTELESVKIVFPLVNFFGITMGKRPSVHIAQALDHIKTK